MASRITVLFICIPKHLPSDVILFVMLDLLKNTPLKV